LRGYPAGPKFPFVEAGSSIDAAAAAAHDDDGVSLGGTFGTEGEAVSHDIVVQVLAPFLLSRLRKMRMDDPWLRLGSRHLSSENFGISVRAEPLYE